MWLLTKEYAKSGKYTVSSFSMLKYKNTKLTDLACTRKQKKYKKATNSVFRFLRFNYVKYDVKYILVKGAFKTLSNISMTSFWWLYC